MITIKDLAAASGLSKSTVSRVINHSPNVKPETRERVMEAVEKLGYQPDILARGMITGMLPMVLVIVGDIQNHYFTQALAGIETTLEDQGFMVVVFDSSYDPERIVTSIHMAKTCRFAGIIPMTGFGSKRVISTLQDLDCPVILLNCHRDHVAFDRIYGDDFGAGYAATRALLRRGYRQIYHFSGNSTESFISAERERGYLAAMKEAGISVDGSMVLRGDLRQDSGARLAARCLKSAKSQVALCCNNFLMCLGAMNYAQQHGLVMWKDYGMAICEQPPVFFMKSEFIYAGPKLREIGRAAAQLLLDRINHPGRKPAVQPFPMLDIYDP